jgi:hypothetical protein
VLAFRQADRKIIRTAVYARTARNVSTALVAVSDALAPADVRIITDRF